MEILMLITKTIVMAYALTKTIAYIHRLAEFVIKAIKNQDAHITSMSVYKPAIAWALFYFFSLVK